MKTLLVIVFLSGLCYNVNGGATITETIWLVSAPEIVTVATCLGYNESDDATKCIGGYRILQGANRDDLIFIGGRNQIVAVNSTDSTYTSIEKVDTCYSTGGFACLSIDSANKFDDCANYIRESFELNTCDASSDVCTIYVCGTNALLPRCFFCNYTVSTRALNCTFQGNDRGGSDGTCLTQGSVFSADDICPSIGTVNASASYMGDKLYFGVAKQPRNKKDSVIAWNRVNTDGSFGSGAEDRVQTRETARDVQDSDFVGMPFHRNGRTYFIFRETAAEYASLVEDQQFGSAIYSRIARVCSNDAGITVGGDQVWTSYQKIRLECAEEDPPGDRFVTYFNEIQAFTNEVKGEDIIIHAIFSNGRNGPATSAVCTYSLNYIDDIFDNSNFFGPNTLLTNPEWTTPSSVPPPRLGLNCSSPATDTDFMNNYPLMESHAKNDQTVRGVTDVKPPFLTIDDRRFSSLVLNIGLYYIATESGSIIKADSNDNTHKNITEYYVSKGEAIKDIAMTDEDGECFVITTAQHVYRICLQLCASSKLPRDDNVTVKPNCMFRLTYTCACSAEPNITYTNGTHVPDSLVNTESLDIMTKTIKIRVLDNITVSFSECDLINPTFINTYFNYTEGDVTDRRGKWTKENETYASITKTESADNCTFSRTLIDDRVIHCDNCTYADCCNESETCPAQ